MGKIKILFVCYANEDRSLTAEHMYKNNPDIEAKSAGVAQSAVVSLNSELIEWADVILCMEIWQQRYVQRIFIDLLSCKETGCLNISDGYNYWDSKLISLIKERMEPWLLKYDIKEVDA